MPAKRYRETGQRIGELVDEKNAAYGDSFHKSAIVMLALFPNGIPPEKYTDALAIVRIVDKLFRLANKKDAFGENPMEDIAGYAIVSTGPEERSDPSRAGQPSSIDRLEQCLGNASVPTPEEDCGSCRQKDSRT